MLLVVNHDLCAELMTLNIQVIRYMSAMMVSHVSPLSFLLLVITIFDDDGVAAHDRIVFLLLVVELLRTPMVVLMMLLK